jgi:hypothetical protein
MNHIRPPPVLIQSLYSFVKSKNQIILCLRKINSLKTLNL